MRLRGKRIDAAAAHVDPSAPLRVLMLGWEYPPLISGGLGTACHGLVRAVNRRNVDVVFVLPNAIEPTDATAAVSGEAAGPDADATFAASLPPTWRRRERRPILRVERVDAPWVDPYRPKPGIEQMTPPKPMRVATAGARSRVVGAGGSGGYDGDLLGKIDRFTERCLTLATQTDFDVIHAHDWMTFRAGQAVAAMSGKPLVAHVHATEFDRSIGARNDRVFAIERETMQAADAVIAVSQLTGRTLIEGYGAPAERVHVIHNGIDAATPDEHLAAAGDNGHGGGDRHERTVLFLGRLTAQKGPTYFVQMAAELARHDPGARFLVAGWGDLGPRMVEQVAAVGLGDRFRFAGFLRGPDVARAYRMASVYVMPSVREPFGLTALEAVRNGASVVLSRTSGVAEVLQQGALHVDHWDVPAMAAKVRYLLDHPRDAAAMRRRGLEEIDRLSWDKAAAMCCGLYERLATATQRDADAAAIAACG